MAVLEVTPLVERLLAPVRADISRLERELARAGSLEELETLRAELEMVRSALEVLQRTPGPPGPEGPPGPAGSPGMIRAGGGFPSARPGKDKVAVGDASGRWSLVDKSTLGGGGGAPSTADYLVGTAQAGLSAEIVVGTTPGGELGGTWAAPTVDAVHSGSSHVATQAAAEATAQAALDAHLTDAVDAHDASAVSSVPAGGLVATNVQTALNELDAEKAALAHAHAGEDITSGTVADARIAATIARDAEVVLQTLADAKGDLVAASAADAWTRLGVGTDGQVLTADATQATGLRWGTPAGGSDVKFTVTQAAHGLAVGDVARFDGSSYLKARADLASTAEVAGLVTAVADASNFTLTTHGRVTGLTGLTSGGVYFLSAVTAGLLTLTEPTTAGHVSKPLLIATSTTTGLLFNFRGLVIAAAENNIPQTIVDAKGDLIVATAADTVARQAVGANNDVLVADSAQSTGVKWRGAIGVRVYNNANITTTTGVWKLVTFNSEDYDDGGFHSTVTDTDRLTVPTGLGGLYVVSASLWFASNATGTRFFQVTKNGDAVNVNPFLYEDRAAVATGAATIAMASAPVKLVDGDFLQLHAFQNSGGNLDLTQSATVGIMFALTRVA